MTDQRRTRRSIAGRILQRVAIYLLSALVFVWAVGQVWVGFGIWFVALLVFLWAEGPRVAVGLDPLEDL